MIVWLTPVMMKGIAIGNCTLNRVCRPVEPYISAASTDDVELLGCQGW